MSGVGLVADTSTPPASILFVLPVHTLDNVVEGSLADAQTPQLAPHLGHLEGVPAELFTQCPQLAGGAGVNIITSMANCQSLWFAKAGNNRSVKH
jgi:hypothetical protein